MEDVKHKGFYEGVNKTFGDWEPAPPAGTWDKIEARLDEDKPRPVLWPWLGGIALLLTLVGGAYFIFGKSPNNSLTNTGSNTLNSPKSQNTIVQSRQDAEERKTNSVNSAVTINPAKASSAKAEHDVKATIKTIVPAASKPKIAFANANTLQPLQKNAISLVSSSAFKTEPDSANSANPTQEKTTQIASVSQATSTGNATQGTIEVDSSFTVSKKSKLSFAEATNVKKDSVITNAQTENVKPQQTIVADSVKSKKDSVASVQVVITDTVKKPVIAQTKDSAKPPLPKISIFSISAFVAPEQAGQVIMQNNSAFNVSGETSNLHFIYGVRGAISLNKKWEVNLAFSYSSVAINFPSTQVLFNRYITQPYVFNSSYGDMSVLAATMVQGFSSNAPLAITSYKMQYQYAQTIQFMNVPVCIRLNLGKGKLKPYITAGLNIQYTLDISSELDLLKETETDVINYTSLNTRKINIAPTASVGIEYEVARHIGVFLEPNARYNLLPSSTSSTIKSSSYFVGCMGGIRLNL